VYYLINPQLEGIMLSWKRKFSFFLPFLFLVGIISVLGQKEPDWTEIDVQITISPSPEYIQIVPGEVYTILVKVLNEGLQLSAGDAASSSDPNIKYSGNFIVDVNLKMGKRGTSLQGNEFVYYEYALESDFKSRNINIPLVGKSRSLVFSKKVEYEYDEDARIDEWLIFTIDAKVYVELYADLTQGRQYIVGWKVDEASSTLFILDETKEKYINDTLTNLKLEMQKVQTLQKIEQKYGWDLELNESITTIVDSMETSIEEGNYVSATEAYSQYDIKWEEKILNVLTSKLVSLESFDKNETLQQDFEILKEQYARTREQYEYLSERVSVLENENDVLENENEDLNLSLKNINANITKYMKEIKNLKFFNQVYLFGLLAVGGTVVIVLFKSGVIEIMIEEEEETLKTLKNEDNGEPTN
jgi:hypothetical protein